MLPNLFCLLQPSWRPWHHKKCVCNKPLPPHHKLTRILDNNILNQLSECDRKFASPSDCWCPGSAKEPLDIEGTVMFGKPKHIYLSVWFFQMHPYVNSDLIHDLWSIQLYVPMSESLKAVYKMRLLNAIQWDEGWKRWAPCKNTHNCRKYVSLSAHRHMFRHKNHVYIKLKRYLCLYTYIQYINPLSRVICVGIHLSRVLLAWQWVSLDVFVLKSWITYRTMSDQHSFMHLAGILVPMKLYNCASLHFIHRSWCADAVQLMWFIYVPENLFGIHKLNNENQQTVL